MKTKKKIILLVIFLVVVCVVVFFKNDIFGKKTILGTNKISKMDGSSEQNFCYQTKTKVEEAPEGQDWYDTKTLEIVKKQNLEVKGFLSYLPAQKGSVTGSFVGVWKDGYINMIYSVEGEGETLNEQKVFRIYEDLVIEAINTEKKEMSGVLMFKDLTKLVFGNDGIFSKVSCKDVEKK